MRYCGIRNRQQLPKNLTQIKVLILYSSGNPGAVVPYISEDINTVTSPTAEFLNTAVIAKMIAHYMKREMLQVTLKNIEEIKRAQDVLFADAILIGSVTRFAIMSWQTKRFFDEILYPVYVHRKTKPRDKYVGCFTTCQVDSSGEDLIKSIHRALYDYGSKKLPNLIILDKTPQKEIEKRGQSEFPKRFSACNDYIF